MLIKWNIFLLHKNQLREGYTKNMTVLCDRSVCTGCMVCRDVCEADAIDVEEENGWSYPVVDGTRCVSCGRCRSVCPVLSGQRDWLQEGFASSKLFAAYNLNALDRLNSSSGGVFVALAKEFLKQGGKVVGAAFVDGLHLQHIIVDSETELSRILRSKYLQSDTLGIYSRVRAELEAGKNVLFCGTPCQVTAMHLFVKDTLREKLFLVGVACHGNASPILFEKYVRWLESEARDTIVDVRFRDKKYGWNCGPFLSVKFQSKGWKMIVFRKNWFFRGFQRGAWTREACSNCFFRANPCGRDLTLADFWGIQNVIFLKPLREQAKGFSGVLVHSEHGESIMRDLVEASKIHMTEVPPHVLATSNGGLKLKKAHGFSAIDAISALESKNPAQCIGKLVPLSLIEILTTLARYCFRSWYHPLSYWVRLGIRGFENKKESR